MLMESHGVDYARSHKRSIWNANLREQVMVEGSDELALVRETL
jgi:hypothetical protein